MTLEQRNRLELLDGMEAACKAMTPDELDELRELRELEDEE